MYSFNDPSLGSQLSFLLGELSQKTNHSSSSAVGHSAAAATSNSLVHQAMPPLHLLAPPPAGSTSNTAAAAAVASFTSSRSGGLLPPLATLSHHHHQAASALLGHHHSSLRTDHPSSAAAASLDLSLAASSRQQHREQRLADLASYAAHHRELHHHHDATTVAAAASAEKDRMIQEYISLTLAINAIKDGTSTSVQRETGGAPAIHSSSLSSDGMLLDSSQSAAVVSERSQIAVNADCRTPEQVFYTLNILGSTLRSKADPYIDASIYRDPGTQRAVRGGICELFPDKLYRMLTELEAEGRSDIVSFLPHGRAFLVHKMDTFLKNILPKYFSEQSKWSSFSRQLNLYGFLRVSGGPDAGAYYHELFLKGHPNLCHYMRRVGAPKGLDRRRYKLPEGKDPNFYTLSLPPQQGAGGGGGGGGSGADKGAAT